MLNLYSYTVAATLGIGSLILSSAISRDLVPPIEDVSGALEQDEYSPGEMATLQVRYTRRIEVRVVQADYTLWCSEGKFFSFKPPRSDEPRSWPVGKNQMANMDFFVPDAVAPGSKCCVSASVTYDRILLPLVVAKVPPQSICFHVRGDGNA